MDGDSVAHGLKNKTKSDREGFAGSWEVNLKYLQLLKVIGVKEEKENCWTVLHFRRTETLLLNLTWRVLRSTPLVSTWKQMVMIVKWPALLGCRTVGTYIDRGPSQIWGTEFDFPKTSDSRHLLTNSVRRISRKGTVLVKIVTLP